MTREEFIKKMPDKVAANIMANMIEKRADEITDPYRKWFAEYYRELEEKKLKP